MKRLLVLCLALSVLGLGSIAGCEKKAETKKDEAKGAAASTETPPAK
jgi:hypothetical protein